MVKSRKEKRSKEHNKDDTLTKILILVIFIIFVFYVPDLWKLYDVTPKIKKALWELGAQDNLNSDLHGIEGEKYVFVEGFLSSSCTKIQSEDHCPLKVLQAQPTIYFDKNTSFYYLDVPMRTSIMNKKAEEVSFAPADVKIIRFIEKEEFKEKNNKIKFIIQDYILKESICSFSDRYVNGTMCPIQWDKEFEIKNISQKKTGLAVDLNEFDIRITNTSMNAVISGIITGNVINPSLEVRVYRRANKSITLDQSHVLVLTLEPEGSGYAFNAEIIVPFSKIQVFENLTYTSIDEENINFTKKTLRGDYSILVLFTDNDYFYAKEKTMLEANLTLSERTYE